MIALLYFSFVVMGAVPFTAALCRRRISRKKRVSIGTLLVGAFISLVVASVWIPLFDGGTAAFTHDYWMHLKVGAGIPYMLVFILWIFTFIPCVLAASGVVIFYQRQRNEENSKLPDGRAGYGIPIPK